MSLSIGHRDQEFARNKTVLSHSLHCSSNRVVDLFKHVDIASITILPHHVGTGTYAVAAMTHWSGTSSLGSSMV
jgi:hypothetical protein